jgi:hypothetical protein
LLEDLIRGLCSPCSFAGLIVACAHGSLLLEWPLRVDRAADVELVIVVSASASLAEVLDLCVDMVGSEAARADALWSACWRDLVDRHRALDS